MKMNPLGRTGIAISEICLGTMTWGEQNSEADGHAQMDHAVEQGINFFDTAEMYPTNPIRAETAGRTEEIIGSWLKARGRRDDIVIATKIVGKGNKTVRDGAPANALTIREAVENSLKRLGTDHIDLYQIHWPNRGSYHFRKYWTWDPGDLSLGDMNGEIADMLGEVEKLQLEGKLKHFGLSNESAWGTRKWLEASERHGLPRVVSIQNEYSLICRIFDLDLAEVAVHEKVGLVAYSPLSAGLLSGKYADGAIPAGSRRTIQETLNGRYGEQSAGVVGLYGAVAQKHGLDLAQMALAFCLTRPFMTSAIIGATSMEQLKTNIAAKDVTLDDAVMADIQAVYRAHPMPM